MKKNKIISFFLSFVMLFTLFGSSLSKVVVSNAANHSQDEAVAWARAQASNPRDFDGCNGVQCVDLIFWYYQYLGVPVVYGNGCDFAWNTLPSGWTRIANYNGFIPQPGDIAVWTYASSSYGHVAIVLSATASNMTVAEFLGSSHTGRVNVYTYRYGTFYGVVRPDFTTPPEITFSDIKEGVYSFVNKSSGLYLNALAYAGQANTSTRICTSVADGTAEQKFRVQSAGNKQYYLRCQSNGNEYCVNAYSPNDVVNAGAYTHLYNFNSNASKLWKFQEENGYYIIYNALNPSVVLTAASNNARASVTVEYKNGSDLQKWKIEGLQTVPKPSNAKATADKTRVQVGSSINFSFSADNVTDYCIGLDRNGSRIFTSGVNSSYSYKCDQPGFYSAYVTCSNASGSVDSNRVYWVVYDNAKSDFYAYIIKQDTWKHVENAVANVQIANKGNDSFDPKQVWHFVKQPDGSFKIINEYNGKLLDVENVGTANNTNVSTYLDNGGKNQRWYLVTFDNATYIVPSYVDKVLDVSNNNNNPGANIAIYDFNGSTAQRFAVYDLVNDKTDYKKPAAPDKPVVSVTPGNAGKRTVITWTESATKGSFDERKYKLNMKQEGSDLSLFAFMSFTGTQAEVPIPLGSGRYYVSVLAYNTKYDNYYTESDKISFEIKDCNHVWDSGEVTKNATCTEAGEKILTCTLCGETKKEEIPASGHSWSDEWVIDRAATEIETGEKSHHCVYCGERKDITVIDKINTTEYPEPVEFSASASQISDAFFNIAWQVNKNAGQDVEYMDARVWVDGADRPENPDCIVESAMVGVKDETCFGSAVAVGIGSEIDIVLERNVIYRFEMNTVIDGKTYTVTDTFSLDNGSVQLSLFPENAFYLGATDSSVYDNTVSVDVILNNNPGIAGMVVSMNYNPEILEITGLKKGDVFDSITGAGDKNIVLDNATNTTDTGILFTVDFRLKDADRIDDSFVGVNIDSCVAINGSGENTKIVDVDYVAVPGVMIPIIMVTPKFTTEILMEAFLENNYLLHESPSFYSLIENTDENGILLDAEGVYSIVFSDIDEDAEDELIAFVLVDDVSSLTGKPVQQLRIEVYDLDENGLVVKSQYCPEGFNTDYLYELDGSYHLYVTLDNGKIILLKMFSYDQYEYDYRVLSYKDGLFENENSYKFFSYSVENETVFNVTHDNTVLEASVGSEEAKKIIADIKTDLKDFVTDLELFPLDENGDIIDYYAFSENSMFEMCRETDVENGIDSFVVLDSSDSIRSYSDYIDLLREPRNKVSTRGDFDGNGQVDSDDAIYLLYYTFLPEKYPIDQDGDVDENGYIDSDDAIYLLYYTFLPDKYPLK
ncbi:MAG: RICIN domain-containing protein [Clostridia bacterium]|nr:RICIN domain-containing protein [Clostridia bacterium]